MAEEKTQKPKEEVTAKAGAPSKGGLHGDEFNFQKRFPIKYKILSVMLFVLFIALTVFFYISYKTFAEDKKLFVMDMNLSVLKATQADIRYELTRRLEEIRMLAPRVYNPRLWKRRGNNEGLYFGLEKTLKEEVISLTYYRRNDPEQPYLKVREYVNDEVVKERKILDETIAKLTDEFPLAHSFEMNELGVTLLNRSFQAKEKDKGSNLPILTMLISGRLVGDDGSDIVVAVDLLGDFLRNSLTQSEMAEVFLLGEEGNLISHSDRNKIVSYASIIFAHPILTRISEEVYTRESLEVQYRGEPYLVNIGQTGFPGVYIISQIQKNQAFLALNTLFTRSAFIAMVILFSTIIVSLWVAGQLTRNIDKLDRAAEEIGGGKLEVSIDVKSYDEIGSVAHRLKWMAKQMARLIADTATKARMESELETAHLIQSVLLKAPVIESSGVQLDSYYQSASECGGDFWDATLKDNKLTVLMGDATGHGAPAALVTAVTKSCFSTIDTVFMRQSLDPADILRFLNHIVYRTCQGQLLITMVVVQLDLESGELIVANAGHEFPLLIRSKKLTQTGKTTDKKSRIRPDVLIARGERLGYEPKAHYNSERFQLDKDDTLLLFTDGLYDAQNPDGKAWGERTLYKTFVQNAREDVTKIKDVIVDSVTEHMQKAEMVDDITFVLLKWVQALEEKEEKKKVA